MKLQVKRLTVLMACLSLFALAGCSGDSSTSTPATTTVSGVVADGYLVGAKVCLDKNGNKVCDADEPTATTTAGGSYTLSNVSSADVAGYPILVEVPAGATDEQRGPVANAYVLGAPAGKTDFISPLTTLVQNQVETTGMSADAAEATVRNALGMNTSLYTNFQPGSASATAEQKLAASVAKVVADTIATNKTAIETAVDASNTTVVAVVNLVMQQVMQQLPTVIQQVQANLVDGVLPENKVATVITNSGVTVSTSNATTLQQELAAAGTTAVTSDLVTAATNGMYGMDVSQNGWNAQTQTPIYGYNYYKTVYTSSNSRINHFEFYLLNGAWASGASDESDALYLTSTGWQADSGAYGVYNASTGIYSSPNSLQNMKVSLVKHNVAGKPMAPYLVNSFFETPAGIDTTQLFPAGSEAYFMTFIPTADTYRLIADWTVCTTWDNNTNTCASYPSSLQSMISSHAYPAGSWVGTRSHSLQFGPLSNSTNTGLLYISNQGNLIATTTYELKTVHNVQMLLADMRVVGENYMLFTVYNGKVTVGELQKANVAVTDNFDFNKTAINAIAAMAGLPAIP